MSWQIQIVRAKPNPAGKDKDKSTPKSDQLLGEWVDLKNVGDESVALSTLNLANIEFSAGCVPNPNPVIYWTGLQSAILQPGQTIRVHTGRSGESWRMASVDQQGVDYHAYAERGTFVLNNRCGDTLSVWWKGNDNKWYSDDSASYEPNVPEGAILHRVGNKLVASSLAGLSR